MRTTILFLVLAFTLTTKAQLLSMTDSTQVMINSEGKVFDGRFDTINYPAVYTIDKVIYSGKKQVAYMKRVDAVKTKPVITVVGQEFNEYSYIVEDLKHLPILKLTQKSGNSNMLFFDVYKIINQKTKEWQRVGSVRYNYKSEYTPEYGEVLSNSGNGLGQFTNIKPEIVGVYYFYLN